MLNGTSPLLGRQIPMQVSGTFSFCKCVFDRVLSIFIFVCPILSMKSMVMGF